MRKSSYAGFIWLITIGPMWHYVYEWSGHRAWVGWIAPANESVWEHLKMGYWALLLFSIAEYWLTKVRPGQFFTAKLVGTIILSGTILMTFYSYSAFTGHSILWVDIFSYVAGAVLCQLAIHRIYLVKNWPNYLNRVAGFLFIGMAWLFAFYTLFPPDAGIFVDMNTGLRGIPR